MNSFSMISYNRLHNSSFKAKLAMELHSHGHVQNGEVAKRANDVLKGLEVESSNVTKEAALLGTKNERADFGSTEHLALPTVFEGKITKEKKVTKQEKMSNIVNLRRSGSNHDVRGADPRPLSPFPSRFLSQKSLDDNVFQPLKGVRMIQRKISSPLPTGANTSSPLSIRRRALSESPAEALVSPVIPRKYFDFENCYSPGNSKLQGGVSRVKSCPVIKAVSNEKVNDEFSLPLTVIPLSKSPSISACSTLKSADQNKSKCSPLKSADNRLPRIHQTHSPRLSPRLVRSKTANECTRELFNVSPIMDQSANSEPDNNDIQCDVTDKVEYYLYSMSVEDDKD